MKPAKYINDALAARAASDFDGSLLFEKADMLRKAAELQACN